MAFDNQNKMHLKHTVFTVGAIEAWHTVTSVLVDQVVACSIVLTRLHLTVVYIWQITNRQCHSKRSSQEFHSTSRKMFIPFCQLNGNRLRFLVKSMHDNIWSRLQNVFTITSLEPCHAITSIIIGENVKFKSICTYWLYSWFRWSLQYSHNGNRW